MIETETSPYIHAATADSFHHMVLEKSRTSPVLVNFCSSTADPCMHQSPILDQVINEYDGLVLLVNVDAESESSISREYGIASFPTLKLFRDGKVQHTLHGIQSETEISQVLEPYIERDSDLILSDAIENYANGKHKTAYTMLVEAIVNDPINPRLPLTICKLLKHEKRYDEAMSLLESLPEEIKDYYEVRPLASMIRFLAQTSKSESIETLTVQLESDPKNISLKRQLCAHYVINNQPDLALEQLSELMQIDSENDDGYIRRSILDLFNLLDENDPLVAHYRPLLRRFTH